MPEVLNDTMLSDIIIIILIPGRYLYCCHHDHRSLQEFTRFIW